MEIKYTKEGIELDGKLIPLKEIVDKFNSAKVYNDNLALMTISWNGRGGSVCEQIVRPLDKLQRLKELLVGKQVYFGEIWGKHSDVYGQIENKQIEITVDKTKVKSFLTHYTKGHNYDHSFIYNYTEEANDQMDEEEFIEGGHEKDIQEINEILK